MGAAIGLGLPASGPGRASDGFATRRSVILVNLTGGMSHIDCLDLKPDAPAEVRGEFKPIPITVPGIQVCEHLPKLAARLREVTGGTVEVAFVDQGYTGAAAADQAKASGIRPEVVKHTEAKRGFVLLPRRWVVERSFAWPGRFRRLARDYERLAEVLAGWHWLAFLTLLLPRLGFNSAQLALGVAT